MKKIYAAFCKIEVVLCCAGFMFLIAFVFLSAILRMFRVSLSWNIDLAMLLLAWTAFMGADIAWRSGQLVGIDLFTRNFPERVQRGVEILIYVIILITMAVIFIFGMRLAWTERVRTYQSMPIPYSLVTLGLALPAASMVISTILKIRGAVGRYGQTGGGR
ncbi:MAG: TRAP transporter small permease subunit [Fusobacteriaceae bacterium]|jgi:TRAP-type C4-dicarboxylate transport system permease small subunit|nr:TRAP transporter small permease subunit [Fusobacteriaceae bacterium]